MGGGGGGAGVDEDEHTKIVEHTCTCKMCQLGGCVGMSPLHSNTLHTHTHTHTL